MSREYVGIDLHRRRSVIVRMNEAGETLSSLGLRERWGDEPSVRAEPRRPRS